MLNSFFDDRTTEAEQTEQARQQILQHRDTAGILVMVTHFVNIGAISGVSPEQGEAVVVRGDAQGAIQVIGRLVVQPAAASAAPLTAAEVVIGPFAIDQTEVTVGQLRQFADATGAVRLAERNGGGAVFEAGWVQKPGWAWRAPFGEPARDDEPAVHVTYDEALAEYIVRDMRLLTVDMVTNLGIQYASQPSQSVIQWLLDSDPAVRWQVLRDLTDAPAEEVAAERARVATEGTGARLLALQRTDGSWAGVAWNRGWDSTMHVLMLLRELGLDPRSEAAHRAVGLVRDRVRWRGWDWDGTWRGEEFAGTPFFAGEVEPCINGQVAAVGAYFGQDVRRLIDRLLGEQLADGGWNCEVANGSTRSSFHTTICVLEALLEYELSGERRPEVAKARLRGQEYLLERRLFRRRSTGEAIADRKASDAPWTRFAFPTWWHYDLLRGLEYLRRAGVAPDDRVAEAISLVVSKRDGDGRWPLEVRHPGRMPVEIDAGEGQPSRWNTLRALRVLHWYATAAAS